MICGAKLTLPNEDVLFWRLWCFTVSPLDEFTAKLACLKSTGTFNDTASFGDNKLPVFFWRGGDVTNEVWFNELDDEFDKAFDEEDDRRLR